MDTIKSNDEISGLFSTGRRLSGKYASFIYVEKGRLSETSCEHDRNGRVAFIAGKKNGGAVWRNSAKRRMRELYREKEQLLEQYDLLMVAKKPIVSASYDDVRGDIEKLAEKLNDA